MTPGAADGSLECMVRAVCFDLMDTLVRDPYREALAAGTGLSMAELRGRRDPSAWPAFERGELDEATFLDRLLPDGSVNRAAFTAARQAGYRPLPGMLPLVAGLRGHVRCWIASNYPVWIEEVVDRFGLRQLVDGVTASCHLGVRKPEPAFFAALSAQVGVPPDRTLLVDDRQANCDAARQLGFAVHRFDGVAGLCDRLRAEGVPVELDRT